VLEIMEGLYSDIADISQGKLLAAGFLDVLRKGIQVEDDGQHADIVGGERSTGEEEVLQWLT